MNRLVAGSFSCLFLVAQGIAQSPPLADQPWRLIHPDATALIGANVRGIRESAVGQSLGSAFQKSSFGMFNFPGLEFLSDIDNVLISSPGQKTPGAKGNPPFLIILTGHFPPDHVQTVLHGQHRPYHGIDIYPPSGDGNASMALIDESTLMIADGSSLEAAIDRRRASTNSSALLKRATSLASANDAWIVVTVPPSAFQPSGLDLGKLVSSIRGVEAGIAFHDGFNLEVNLAMKDAEAARELAQQLSVQLLSAVSGKLDDQQAAELARKLQVGSQGSQMSVKFALSREELDRQIHSIQAARASATTLLPRPEPKQPGTIKIFGLDEGTREIPLTPAKRP